MTFYRHKLYGLIYFVLYPLQEIKPEWRHPENDKPISVLIDELPMKDKKSILKLENT